MADDLLRYGEASATLEADPSLHEAWATSTDRAVRRAVLRSPAITAEVAGLVLATRRSGMHTLGANPAAPADLLDANPGAQRRRAAVDALLPDGLAAARRRPNRPDLVALGSPTVDLVLARAPSLDEPTAVALAARTDPPADPWVLAVLASRFGDPVRDALAGAAPARRRAVARLLDRAERTG